MRDVTLCYFLTEDKILLAMKKRGFGEGLWNGYGGKVEEGETIREAACREIKEESDLDTKEEDLEEVGVIDFFFKDREDWNQRVHIFFIRVWEGIEKETEEMNPKWFDIDSMPTENLWKDDRYWLPEALSGKKIEAKFLFTKDGKDIKEMNIKYS
jgi:ADP-ribose pyrophosphatase YjhB (NUDIX family)